MQIDVSFVLDAYKDELNKMHHEIILLKAQVEQLKHNLEEKEKEKEE